MFEGEKVILRTLELSDVEVILEHFNSLKLRTFLATPLPYAREEEENWIRNTWQQRQNGTAYHFAIVDKTTMNLIGTCGLANVHAIARTAELGIAIYEEKNWGKGFGTDTMKVLLRFGFEFLNLHRIQLQVYAFNVRAIRTYEKVGFTTVGKLRQAHFVNGKYVDVYLMDILVEEWLSKNGQ